MTERLTCMLVLHQWKSSYVVVSGSVNLFEFRAETYNSQIRINTRNPCSGDRVWQWLEKSLRLPLRGIGSPDLGVVVAAHDTDAKFCPFWNGNLCDFFAVQTLDRSSEGKNGTLPGTVIYMRTWENRRYVTRNGSPHSWDYGCRRISTIFFLAKEFLVGWWQRLTNAKSLCRLHRDKEDWPTRRRWDHYHPFLPLGFQDEAYFVHPDVGQGPRMFAPRQTKSFPLQRMWKSFVRNSVISVTTELDIHSRHLSKQLLLW